MAEEKIRPEEEVLKNPIPAGTFFDTFEFGSEPAPTKKTDEELEEERVKKEEEEAAAEKKKEDAALEDDNKKEEPQPTPEELQEQIEATATALKEKKEEDLDDDEKQFLKDYEEGNLKDYTPPVEAPEKKEEEPTKEGFDTLAQSLIDEGVLEATEELEDSQEGFSNLIKKTVDSRVEAWVNEIPEEYRNVLDHMRTGGDVNSYLQARQKIDYEGLDYTNEQVQVALVKGHLEQQGYSEDDIKEKLTDLKDLEKLEKEAKVAGKFYAKQQEERLIAEDKKIADAIAAQDKADQDEIDEISSTIDSLDEIAGFKLTPKRKEAFKNFLFEVDADGETAASKSQNNMENRIKSFFMSFINFDFSDMQKQVESKKSRDLSNILNRYTDTQTRSKGTVVKEKDPEPEEKAPVFPSMFGGLPQEQ